MIKYQNIFLLLIAFLIIFTMIFPALSFAGDEDEVISESTAVEHRTIKAWSGLLEKYQNFIVGIAGVGVFTMVILFIIQFMKLMGSAGNPSARKEAIAGVFWTGLGVAGFGSVGLVASLFYRAIN